MPTQMCRVDSQVDSSFLAQPTTTPAVRMGCTGKVSCLVHTSICYRLLPSKLPAATSVHPDTSKPCLNPRQDAAALLTVMAA